MPIAPSPHTIPTRPTAVGSTREPALAALCIALYTQQAVQHEATQVIMHPYSNRTVECGFNAFRICYGGNPEGREGGREERDTGKGNPERRLPRETTQRDNPERENPERE